MRRAGCHQIAFLAVLALLVVGIGNVPAFAGDDEPTLTTDECKQTFTIDGAKDKAYEKELVKPGNPAGDGMVPGIVAAQSKLKLPYTPSSLQDRNRFQCAFDSARVGLLGTAAALLFAFDYQVLKSPDGQLVTLIEKAMWPSIPEKAPAKYRGWGLYVIRRAGAANVTVEAPHACEVTCPGGDDQTDRLAVDVFQKATAKYLLVAGAQRQVNGIYAAENCPQVATCADMSHQPFSIFQRVHKAAFKKFLGSNAMMQGSARATYQPHAFLPSLHDGSGSGDDLKLVVNHPTLQTNVAANIVVSNGTGGIGMADSEYPSAHAKALADAIIAASSTSAFHLCVFNGEPKQSSIDDGTATPQAKADGCGRLGATRNEQGLHLLNHNKDTTADDIGEFFHVEADVALLSNSATRMQLATAIGSKLNGMF